MKNTPSRSTSLTNSMMVKVLEPERGYFSIETVKRWAIETAFIEEGKILEPDSISLEDAISILHRYNFAKISREILDN